MYIRENGASITALAAQCLWEQSCLKHDIPSTLVVVCLNLGHKLRLKSIGLASCVHLVMGFPLIFFSKLHRGKNGICFSAIIVLISRQLGTLQVWGKYLGITFDSLKNAGKLFTCRFRSQILEASSATGKTLPKGKKERTPTFTISFAVRVTIKNILLWTNFHLSVPQM